MQTRELQEVPPGWVTKLGIGMLTKKFVKLILCEFILEMILVQIADRE